ncbi:hypothetical protein [Sulfuriroseicoccus oceanibius]|uniref:Uncharacterized protein n=1 Tax=Sulfuriroseicoccus oceanibius TaxID=2707525 RepID=A0A7T7JBX2_9BACT|nr:hypothetical protein [Sulfuriroseicoccus oceanibius]QQL44411.1 hypothetical protein G3M56_011015 [Sulfuriroseicoccus oceanibius]
MSERSRPNSGLLGGMVQLAGSSDGAPTPQTQRAKTFVQQKKTIYPVHEKLHDYLRKYHRATDIELTYDSLMQFNNAYPLEDEDGNDTLWRVVAYEPVIMRELNEKLTRAYAKMKTEGDISVIENLAVERIDYCEFGNSHPFRIRIVNRFNDNYDHFYVKQADTSRIYGLELEHLLSPNRITYLVRENTLFEEHIAGVPGDQFIENYFKRKSLNKVRIAKEFIKFNERCFVRLLGDMRCYNYVVDITPDFEGEQYRVRSIDFDQQCYEGQLNVYCPHRYDNNQPVVDLCAQYINPATVRQYQVEERVLIARRYRAVAARVRHIIDCMRYAPCSSYNKVQELVEGLNEYHGVDRFTGCQNMAEILERQLDMSLAVARRNVRTMNERNIGRL